jgi:hypothetical protein
MEFSGQYLLAAISVRGPNAAGSFAAPPQLPVLSVAPPGFPFPQGESAQMVQYDGPWKCRDWS